MVADTAEYINGMAFKPSDWGDRGKPIIRIQNLTDAQRSFTSPIAKLIRGTWLKQATS